jgi:hypothetical protein
MYTPVYTPVQIKAIKKVRSAAARAYAAALAVYDAIPDRDEVAKEISLFYCERAAADLAAARAAMSEVTRAENAAAARANRNA